MRVLIPAVIAVLSISSIAGQRRGTFCADGPAGRPPSRLLPVDEASRQPDFFTFRARLQTAVAAKGIDAVIAAADPNVKLGFGGEDGVELLRKNLTAETAAPYWKEIARMFALGGAFKNDDMFLAPYYSAKWPAGADSFECGVIIGRGVNVRREAKADGDVIAIANYDIVDLMTGALTYQKGWSVVELANGTKGYLHSDFVSGPTGLRAVFNRVNGQWRLTALVAGD